MISGGIEVNQLAYIRLILETLEVKFGGNPQVKNLPVLQATGATPVSLHEYPPGHVWQVRSEGVDL